MAKPDRNSVNIPPLKIRRRELRNNPTAAEYVLWQHLKGRQVLGRKFRRQHSISRYIVDFYCAECDLAVELDGAPHFQELNAASESERTEFLQSVGLEILRFENRVVFENIEAVLETIREAIRNRLV
jgi:very-short-patch-repair endonuclease